VVLVSFAGDRQGHALVLHQTTGGPHWIDPDGGAVSAAPARPAAAGRAVAAWAVVVGRDGRVAEPGAWSAPGSAGGIGMLADPPLRHDFGAMGVEIERHNIRLFWPDGRKLPEKAVLLRSRDGLVRVVVDKGGAWLAEDGFLYEAHAGQGGMFMMAMSVPEMVGVPWRVLAEPGRPGQEAVQARIRAVNQRFDDQLMLIGSANCNNRGLETDSELIVATFEDSRGDDSAARRLRQELWSLHLGVPASSVTDPVSSRGLWDTAPGRHVRQYSAGQGRGPLGLRIPDSVVDPSDRRSDDPGNALLPPRLHPIAREYRC